MSNKAFFIITVIVNYLILKDFFSLLMNVLIILKTIFLYIKNLFHLKGFGAQFAPYKKPQINTWSKQVETKRQEQDSNPQPLSS